MAMPTSEKDKKEETAAQDRKENCAAAQKQLQALESGQRITAQNDQGEKIVIDDQQRAKEAERARRLAADNCGK
jgi:hypothetical protein